MCIRDRRLPKRIFLPGTSVQELSFVAYPLNSWPTMTVPIFKLSNQIEPLYLQYSSHTDGHNSRFVDTTAILRTGHIFYHTEKPTTPHWAMILDWFHPRLSVVTAAITISSPASFFIRRSRRFCPDVRTLSIGTCSRYRIYVQQYKTTLIRCT